MIKMIAILKRKPGITFEEFRRHYDTSHVPLVKGIMGDNLMAYVRNYAAGDNPFPVGESGNDIDCITEFHFADMAALERAVANIEHPDNAPAVRADELKFLDTGSIRIVVTEVETREDGVYEPQ